MAKQQDEFLEAIKERSIRPGYLLRYIDKEAVSRQMKAFSQKGTPRKKRTPRLIVSLTSFPERMYDIHFCLHSLLNQTLMADEVVLWLAEEQFPGREKDVPLEVLELLKNGLTIQWCKDTRSYKKLIPALSEYPKDIIVTADDDIYYPTHWLELLYAAFQKKPRSVHCHRAHGMAWGEGGELLPYAQWRQCVCNIRPSFSNFFTGSGGVLYPPQCLHEDVFHEALFNRIAASNDDIWFWAMAVRNKTKINVIKDNIKDLVYINPERELGVGGERTLGQINNSQKQNDSQLDRLFDYYPEVKTILKAELKEKEKAGLWGWFWSRRRFDPQWYLEQNPDVVASGMDAHEHYKKFGKAEGRPPAAE